MISSSDYIEWATTWTPDPSGERVAVAVAAKIYDEVDDRLGDLAEGDDFLTRVLWLETALRLAQVGWRISELEDQRWPLRAGARIAEVLRGM